GRPRLARARGPGALAHRHPLRPGGDDRRLHRRSRGRLDPRSVPPPRIRRGRPGHGDGDDPRPEGGAAAGRTAPRGEGGGPRPSRRLHLRAGGGGGGLLIVPAPTPLGGLSMADATGPSPLVLRLPALAGLARPATHVQMDGPLLGTIAAFAVAGSLFGSRIGRKLSAAALRQSFGWFVLCMAGFILLRETPAELLGVPALRAGGAVALLLVVGAAI